MLMPKPTWSQANRTLNTNVWNWAGHWVRLTQNNEMCSIEMCIQSAGSASAKMNKVDEAINQGSQSEIARQSGSARLIRQDVTSLRA